ncbi:MAG: SprB repeat-containing protein [Flavobacteriales bacterium]
MLCSLMAAAADSLHVSVVASNYNGYQVSCFGMKDGWITLNVTGGASPYTYKWSNGATTQGQSELAAGYYKVEVTDQGDQRVTLEVTLEQPLPMKLDVDVYEYPNGYNISCYDCNNGNASVVVIGGAAPFTVSWGDGPTGANRYNLGPRDYKIMVSDANGCAGTSTVIYLRGPERSNWGMDGNGNTTPGQQYMGTPDAKDVVFKSNGQERLRLKANGEIGLLGADTTAGMLYRDFDGSLKIGGGPTYPVFPSGPCAMGFSYTSPIWLTKGNYIPTLCPDVEPPRLGTLGNSPVDIITNNQVRMNFSENGGITFYGEGDQETMRIDMSGKVSIGTIPPIGPLVKYRLFVENGIATRDVFVKLGAWPDYVFQPNYALMPLEELRDFLKANKHLPGIPSAAELEAKQGVEVGDLQARILKVVEEQALYILQLEEKQSAMEKRLNALEAERH